MEPTFRFAGDEDIETILGFMRRLYIQDHLTFEERVARATLAAIVQDRGLGRVWIICDGEEPIGYAILTLGYSLEYRGRDAFVDDLYLAPELRGRGLGGDALAAVEAAARELGVRMLHLEVERENRSAAALYLRRGFRDNERQLLSKRLDAPASESPSARQSSEP